MTFQELLISSSGEHGLLDKISTYILKSHTLLYETLRFKDILSIYISIHFMFLISIIAGPSDRAV